MLDYLYLALYKFFGLLLKILPRFLTIKLMRGLAWLMYMLSAKHRKIINTNLNIAFDNLSKKEKKSIGISAFMNLIDTIFGIVLRDGMSKDEVVKNVTFEGDSIVNEAIKEGKKIIFVTGHQGNWELLSQSIAIHFNMTLVGVGRKLDSDTMDKVLKVNRERFNVEMVYKKGAMKGCIKALGENKAIGILTDQAIRLDQSIEVEFFGEKATHTPLASILSRKFGIDLIPAYISTKDYINYHVKVYPSIKSVKTDNQEDDLAKITQAQAQAMETVIKENPKEWFWMHKRWKNSGHEVY
jgi:KDO2-lipid IV(A) lauroyltransferase